MFSPLTIAHFQTPRKSTLEVAKDCWVGVDWGPLFRGAFPLLQSLVLGSRPTHAGMLVFLLAKTLQGLTDFSAK